MTQYQADNNMWKNMVNKDLKNLPLATLARVGFLLKDFTGLMRNSKTDKLKYNRMKRKAIESKLVDKNMNFK